MIEQLREDFNYLPHYAKKYYENIQISILDKYRILCRYLQKNTQCVGRYYECSMIIFFYTIQNTTQTAKYDIILSEFVILSKMRYDKTKQYFIRIKTTYLYI